MSPPAKDQAHDRAARFIAALARYVPSGGEQETPRQRAALATLRRGLGKPAGEVIEMYPYVVPYLPEGLHQRQEEAYFIVAALFGMHPHNWPGEGKPWATNLGASFRRLQQKRDNPSLEKRFAALLDASREALEDHLRQAVSLLRSEEIPVNYLQLLKDIQAWDYEDRSVQRAWARAFWNTFTGDDHGADTASDDAEKSDR
jgi:CRISPR system Cascade subunit CasB